jgi:hypothetical protein
MPNGAQLHTKKFFFLNEHLITLTDFILDLDFLQLYKSDNIISLIT